MVSAQQVYALHRVIGKMIDKHYREKIEKLDEKIEDIKDEMIDKMFSEDFPLTDYLFDVDFDESGFIVARFEPQVDFAMKMEELDSQREALMEEWHKNKEKLETYKDLLLISKDSIIDVVEMPKDLEKFLFLAVESLEE